MNYEMIAIRSELTEMARRLEFQGEVLRAQSARIAALEKDNKAIMGHPRIREFTAVDAYRNAIGIVESMKDDFWTRNIPDQKSKDWVIATIEDISRTLYSRLNRVEEK